MPQATTAQGLGRQAIDPLAGGDRLAGLRIGAERGPVAFLLDLLVGNRALDDQHEGIELALLGLVPEFQEVVAVLVGEDRIVQMDLRQAGDCAQQNVFDAGLSGRGNGDRVSITAQAGRDPENVDLGDGDGF